MNSAVRSLPRRTPDMIVGELVAGDFTLPVYRLEIETGQRFDVPQYIKRIQGKGLTPGWQIAFARQIPGRYFRFFSDSRHGDHPEVSLAVAVRALIAHLEGVDNIKISNLRQRETKSKPYRTGVAGVRTIWLYDKRTHSFNLKVEARIGLLSQDGEVQRRHVGSEFTVDEWNLRKHSHAVWKWRRQSVERRAQYKGEHLKKVRGRKNHLNLDMDVIYGQLVDFKNRNYLLIEQNVRDRIALAVSGEKRLTVWRKVPIRWKTVHVGDTTIRAPDFIDLDGDHWSYHFPLPDGASYGDSLAVSQHPLVDIQEIILECFMASVMTTVTPKIGIYDD